MLKKYIKLFGGLTPPTPFVTSIEADFACHAYSTHTCKVHVRPSRELVRLKSVFLHSAAIHLVGIAGKNATNLFLKRTNSRLGPYMYFAIVFTLCITGKVCLD